MITAVELRDILDYDAASGRFTWRVPRRNRAIPYTSAGMLARDGYIVICIRRRKYKAHRLAWLYMTGEWPAAMVDHADRLRSNNTWSNLRLTSRTLNNANTVARRTSISGIKGVQYRPKLKKWRAYIGINSKSFHLGFFATSEQAAAAYRQAAEKLFGEFARAA